MTSDQYVHYSDHLYDIVATGVTTIRLLASYLERGQPLPQSEVFLGSSSHPGVERGVCDHVVVFAQRVEHHAQVRFVHLDEELPNAFLVSSLVQQQQHRVPHFERSGSEMDRAGKNAVRAKMAREERGPSTRYSAAREVWKRRGSMGEKSRVPQRAAQSALGCVAPQERERLRTRHVRRH